MVLACVCHQLVVLLSSQHKKTVLQKVRPNVSDETHQGAFQVAIDENALPLREFEATYPRYPSVDSIELTPKERKMWVDLRPYMGVPHTVQMHSSLPRAYHIFRSLGLRHMVVVDDGFEVAGVITRTRMAPHSVEEVRGWCEV